jgi:hypothetical protein
MATVRSDMFSFRLVTITNELLEIGRVFRMEVDDKHIYSYGIKYINNYKFGDSAKHLGRLKL